MPARVPKRSTSQRETSTAQHEKRGYELRRKAEADMEKIGDYTLKEHGDAQLVTYLGLLNNAFRNLAADSTLGKKADDIRKGYFRLHVGHHMIYFKRKKTGVEIVRVLHERMSPQRHL
jgi:toxin ParE1/3/4